MDYAYSIQGWLKAVNSSTLANNRDIGHDGQTTGDVKHSNFGRDALAFTIHYYQGDYSPVESSLASPGNLDNYFLIDRYDSDNSAMQTASPNLYNGNIGGITLSITSTENLTMAMHGYAYQYDQLNRLKGMKVWTQTQDDIPGEGETNAYDENTWTNGQLGSSYIETYKYDFNGNISDLTRRDASGALYDDFDYNYAQSLNGKLLHNKLGHVDDSEINSALTTDLEDQAIDNYTYDEIGNLYKDQKEEIDYIEWTAFNKPRNIYRTSTSTKDNLEFVYDAAGQRIGKIVKGAGYEEQTAPQLEWNYTYYVKDLDGNVMATYEGYYQAITDENWDYQHTINLTELHVYGSSRLGIRRDKERFQKKFNATSTEIETAIHYDGNPENGEEVIELTFSDPAYDDVEPELPFPCEQEPCNEMHIRTLGLYSYELSNHQGNVNVVISDQKIAIQNGSGNTILYYKSDIQMLADYTPFGMEMPGRVEQTDEYRYGFQGQESDSEISGSESHLSFEYRIHDGRIGRFFSVDPLCVKFPWNSNYAFAENRLIDGIELEGLEWTADEEYTKTFADGNTYTVKKMHLDVRVYNYSSSTNTEEIMKAQKDYFESKFTMKDEGGSVFYVSTFSYHIMPAGTYPCLEDFNVFLIDLSVNPDPTLVPPPNGQAFNRPGSTQTNSVTFVVSQTYVTFDNPATKEDESSVFVDIETPEEIAQTGLHEYGHSGGLYHPFMDVFGNAALQWSMYKKGQKMGLRQIGEDYEKAIKIGRNPLLVKTEPDKRAVSILGNFMMQDMVRDLLDGGGR